MLALDGTAHNSLEYQVCIVEKLNAARLAEIRRAASPLPPQRPIWRLQDVFLAVAYTPERDSVLSGLETYAYDNWDSEGARAITSEVINWSRDIIRLIPTTAPSPDVSPAANGSVCMEWAKGNDFVWADVERNGRLLTLVKVAGKKTESAFDIGDSRIRLHLATALTSLFS